LAKAKTIGANFGVFGNIKPKLEKTSSSFLHHRDKCVEKVKISESKSNATMSKKVVLFNKKRKRDNNDNKENVYKRRRIDF